MASSVHAFDPSHAPARRVSWDSEAPETIEEMKIGDNYEHVWHLPTVAYLHLGALFGSVCMTSDALSLGYLAIFLLGCLTLTERAVWKQGSQACQAYFKAWPFQGARGGSMVLNLYVATILCFSIAAFLFHAHIIAVKIPNADDDPTNQLGSKDGRLFVALISMGLDTMAFCTAAAIANTHKLVSRDSAHVSVHEMAIARHSLAVLTVSLNPCALTAPYFLYALFHLWCWTLCPRSSSTDMQSRAFRMSHKLLGYYAGLHLFFVYLLSADLDGVSISLACPLARILGLEPLATWSWASWASSSSLLFFFLACFKKVCASGSLV